MNAQRWRIALTALFVVALTAGCAQVPQQELDAAQTALDGAADAGAPTYAADAWNTAREAMQAAQAEIEAQSTKLAPLRRYTEARNLITAASEKAQAAATAAAEGKEQVRQEAQAALADVRGALGTAQTLIAALESCPRRPKGFEADLTSLQGSLAGLTSQADQADGDLQREALMEARTLAQTLQTSAHALVTDLEGAKTKLRC